MTAKAVTKKDKKNFAENHFLACMEPTRLLKTANETRSFSFLGAYFLYALTLWSSDPLHH